MAKEQLLEEAGALGLDVDESNTVAEIEAALAAARENSDRIEIRLLANLSEGSRGELVSLKTQRAEYLIQTGMAVKTQGDEPAEDASS
jgi:hypothetical protein